MTKDLKAKVFPGRELRMLTLEAGQVKAKVV